MDTLSYKTRSARRETVQKEWVLFDAEGVVLGRIASEIAKHLRGKNKPDFTPHIDCGDHVIVINAEKVVLSGDKWQSKQYIRYSGYPGGQKIRTAREMQQKKPATIIEKAVKGMLPHNRLGRAIYKNLYVYTGNDHPHHAQKPKEIKIN